MPGVSSLVMGLCVYGAVSSSSSSFEVSLTFALSVVVPSGALSAVTLVYSVAPGEVVISLCRSCC